MLNSVSKLLVQKSDVYKVCLGSFFMKYVRAIIYSDIY